MLCSTAVLLPFDKNHPREKTDLYEKHSGFRLRLRLALYLPLVLFIIQSLIFIGDASAQTGTLSGRIRDAASGEDLVGGVVYVEEIKKAVSVNSNGIYSLTLPEGQYHIKVTSFGYNTIADTIQLSSAGLTRNYALDVFARTLKTVEVSADGAREQVNKTQMGRVEIPIELIKQLPVLFGEVDVLKTIQLLPGVQSGGEGTTGFYVRGGGPDQNLILMDDAVIYNANHLFGLFSVFNGDAVKNLELYKGGYPSQYGGRLSSVVDVNMRDGNNKKITGTGGIGLIASRLTLEGPIKKDRGSWIISGRRTYFDIFTRAYNKTQESKPDYTPIPDYFFYDLNAKANYQLDSNNRLYVSAYYGRDKFHYARGLFDFNFYWGNATASARWTHTFNRKLFVNTSAYLTDYVYNIGNESKIFQFQLGSSIRDYGVKQNYTWTADIAHDVRFGWNATYHTFEVGRLSLSAGDSTRINLSQVVYGWDYSVYGNDDWEITDRIKVNYGLRISGFSSRDKLYINPEPRVSMRYKFSDNFSLKGSVTRMVQYIHLVASSGASLPTDVWYPSTRNVTPQKADQISIGPTILLWGKRLILTDEVYYKKLYNQIDFRNGAQLFQNPKLEQEFIFGRGQSYGNEIMIEKRDGRLKGWIGYTLAYAERYYDSINNGKLLRPKYDIRNDLKIVATYELNKRITFSATFVYSTGTLTTVPTGFTYRQGISNANSSLVPDYGSRNNFRIPGYDRADLGMVYKLRPRKYVKESDLTFSVYNAYNTRNTYFVYIDQVVDDKVPAALQRPQNQAKTVSLFPIIPSITYNFKF